MTHRSYSRGDADEFYYPPVNSIVQLDEAVAALNVILRQRAIGKIDESDVPMLIDMLGLADVGALV